MGHSFAAWSSWSPGCTAPCPTAEVAVLALGKPAQRRAGRRRAQRRRGRRRADAAGVRHPVRHCRPAGGPYAATPRVILPDTAVLDAAWQARLQRLPGRGRAAGAQRHRRARPAHRPLPAGRNPGHLPRSRADHALLPAPGCSSGGGESEAMPQRLATDYDYVFYDPAYLVEPAARRGMPRRDQARPVQPHLGALHQPPACPGRRIAGLRRWWCKPRSVLYFAAPLFSAYRAHDYWAYREIAAQRPASTSCRPPLLIPGGPGWVEFTLHTQPESSEHPARQHRPRGGLPPAPLAAVHPACRPILAYLRPQLSSARWSRRPQRVYLAPEGSPLPHTYEDGYLKVELPPVGAHAVVVIE